MSVRTSDTELKRGLPHLKIGKSIRFEPDAVWNTSETKSNLSSNHVKKKNPQALYFLGLAGFLVPPAGLEPVTR